MAGRSWPNRALTASTPCPAGTLGAVGATCACAPGLAAAGSDGSNGPFGATLPLGGMRLWVGAGGTDGTSRGGRSVKLSGPWVLPKNCALAVAASAASQTPAAKTSWPPLPSLVPPILMTAVFEGNSGKFKPLAGGLSPLPPYARRSRRRSMPAQNAAIFRDGRVPLQRLRVACHRR